MKKRIAIISDLHCGHFAGLTPPAWHVNGSRERFGRWEAQQKLMWTQYVRMMKALQPIHLLIVNGDGIDGKGYRSQGTELIVADRNEQCDMAVKCIQVAKAKHVLMTYGTAYNTGDGEDWELNVAERVGADKIGSHEWADVNGCIFDLKHHVGGSTIPHGRATPILREKLWNAIWADKRLQPDATIVIRSHVHYYVAAWQNGVLAINTAGLQGYGSKYGSRRVSGTVDVGLEALDVDDKGVATFVAGRPGAWLFDMQPVSPEPLKL